MSTKKSALTETEVSGCYNCPYSNDFHGDGCFCQFYHDIAKFDSEQFSKPSFCNVVLVTVREALGVWEKEG